MSPLKVPETYDIESAPKDGTWVILMSAVEYASKDAPCRCCVGRWLDNNRGGGWYTYDGDKYSEEDGYHPERWLPLPDHTFHTIGHGDEL